MEILVVTSDCHCIQEKACGTWRIARLGLRLVICTSHWHSGRTQQHLQPQKMDTMSNANTKVSSRPTNVHRPAYQSNPDHERKNCIASETPNAFYSSELKKAKPPILGRELVRNGKTRILLSKTSEHLRRGDMLVVSPAPVSEDVHSITPTPVQENVIVAAMPSGDPRVLVYAR